MRDRLMVGHIPLEDSILVRIQVPQQGTILRLASLEERKELAQTDTEKVARTK